MTRTGRLLSFSRVVTGLVAESERERERQDVGGLHPLCRGRLNAVAVAMAVAASLSLQTGYSRCVGNQVSIGGSSLSLSLARALARSLRCAQIRFDDAVARS